MLWKFAACVQWRCRWWTEHAFGSTQSSRQIHCILHMSANILPVQRIMHAQQLTRITSRERERKNALNIVSTSYPGHTHNGRTCADSKQSPSGIYIVGDLLRHLDVILVSVSTYIYEKVLWRFVDFGALSYRAFLFNELFKRHIHYTLFCCCTCFFLVQIFLIIFISLMVLYIDYIQNNYFTQINTHITLWRQL